MTNDKESQSEKFKRAARELGADKGDEESLDRALKKMRKDTESENKGAKSANKKRK